MKSDIHPQYYKNAKVVCACGNTFEVGSTQKELRVEICSACHPFYTGKQKLIDTARRVEKFEERAGKKAAAAKGRVGKKIKRAMRDSKRKSISEKPKKLEIKKLSPFGGSPVGREIKDASNGSKKIKGTKKVDKVSARGGSTPESGQAAFGRDKKKLESKTEK